MEGADVQASDLIHEAFDEGLPRRSMNIVSHFLCVTYRCLTILGRTFLRGLGKNEIWHVLSEPLNEVLNCRTRNGQGA